MSQCPKESDSSLEPQQLRPGLSAQGCPSCGGAWIPFENYSRWRQQAPPSAPVLPLSLNLDFQTAPLDGRAALCPECRHYLVRGRINLRSGSFFVERCPNCQGFWCDGGEWPVLEALGLDTRLEQIFSGEWQTHIRERELVERERLATQDKLGPELAAKLFELAALLEEHPNGDFGVAYLMRRFEA